MDRLFSQRESLADGRAAVFGPQGVDVTQDVFRRSLSQTREAG